MSFSQVMSILRARWLVGTVTFSFVVAVIVIVTFIWPKQYTATTSVVVDSKSDPVAANAAGGMAGQTMSTYVNTQADIIGSIRVAQRVVKSLKLDQSEEARKIWEKTPDGDVSMRMASYIVDRKLTVAPLHDSPTHGSNVIEISVKWRDPQTAAALANAFAQAAIETNIELKVNAAKQYATWFEQRSRDLHADLEAKQKKLSDFQNANGIVATDEKLDVESARLTELSTELVNIQGQRQDAQSRQRQVGSDIESLPEVLQSPVIQSLKASLAQAEAKLPDLAANLGKNHPDYQAAVAEIAHLRSRIAQESANIAASLGTTTQVNVRRENEVRQALEAQKKRVLELKHQHDIASVLESDVTAAQRDLDEVTQRLAQSNLESLTQQTNLVQLTYAEPPQNPSSPKLLLNLVIGIFLGGIAGVGASMTLELRNRRIREDQEMVALLGIPLLGRIKPSRVTPNDRQRKHQGRLQPSTV